MSFAAVFDHEQPQNFLYTFADREAVGRMDGRTDGWTASTFDQKLSSSYNENIYCRALLFHRRARRCCPAAECCRLGKGQHATP